MLYLSLVGENYGRKSNAALFKRAVQVVSPTKLNLKGTLKMIVQPLLVPSYDLKAALWLVNFIQLHARLVATGGDEGFIWKFFMETGLLNLELSYKDSVSSLHFRIDGRLLASGSFDGLVKIWDASSGDLKCTLEYPSGGIEVINHVTCSESGSIEENIWGIVQFGCGMLTEVPTFYWENLVKQSVLVLMMQPSEYGIQEVVKIFMVLEVYMWITVYSVFPLTCGSIERLKGGVAQYTRSIPKTAHFARARSALPVFRLPKQKLCFALAAIGIAIQEANHAPDPLGDCGWYPGNDPRLLSSHYHVCVAIAIEIVDVIPSLNQEPVDLKSRSGGQKSSANPAANRDQMNTPANHDEDEDQGDVFLDENDIVLEINVDDEDLPDAEDADDDAEDVEEADDSMHIFTGHTVRFPSFLGVGELYTVACSPIDPRLVATGGGDDKGFIWKILDGDWAFELGGMCHKDSVFSLDFSMDGQLLASGSFDGLVKIWDASSGDLKCTLEGPGGGIEWVRWHPRGHVVLAGSEDCTVWMWNADRGAYLNMFSGHASSVTCGDFTPDGKTICTGSDDATLRIWNPSSGENIHVVRGHPYHTEGLTCLAITSDSTLALTGSKDSSVHVVNITTGKV
ncbi:Angio-associated migratory cell protein [Vitis vinifera]|uniref:Angio-associated migratory cell protein n=1 Tax=Vitis vinifera TaxID=29760 RepID=A0A438E8J9_VITVI|nr:Angio-associated migratory cell protein [Vitis vinifera]